MAHNRVPTGNHIQVPDIDHRLKADQAGSCPQLRWSLVLFLYFMNDLLIQSNDPIRSLHAQRVLLFL